VAALIATVAVGSAVYKLAFGGGDLSSATPSATYRRGWIFHEKRELTLVPYPGAGHYVHLVTEHWKETAPPYRARALTYPSYSAQTRVEMGSAGSDRYAYDPRSKTIYEDRGTPTPFHDSAAYNRQMIETGRWKVAKKLVLDGRNVLRIENAIPTVTYYVDADTYVLDRIEAHGYPLEQPGKPKPHACTYIDTEPTKTVDQLQVYEYLPPTKDNLKLLDIQAHHPSAPTLPANAMPKQFKTVVNPPSCNAQPQP
jgi:hypothetical protein